MKKLATIFFALVLTSIINAQNIEIDAFKSSFQPIIEQSIKGFNTGEAAPAFPASSSTEYVVNESEGKTSFRAVFSVEGRDAAIKLKEHLAMHVEQTLPEGDFKKAKGYGAEYFDYLKYTFEYNTNVYADVKKRPVIVIGALKDGDVYTVEMILTQPFFPNQYSPVWR